MCSTLTVWQTHRTWNPTMLLKQQTKTKQQPHCTHYGRKEHQSWLTHSLTRCRLDPSTSFVKSNGCFYFLAPFEPVWVSVNWVNRGTCPGLAVHLPAWKTRENSVEQKVGSFRKNGTVLFWYPKLPEAYWLPNENNKVLEASIPGWVILHQSA